MLVLFCMFQNCVIGFSCLYNFWNAIKSSRQIDIVNIYVCMHIRMYVCMYVFMYVHMYLSMYVCMYSKFIIIIYNIYDVRNVCTIVCTIVIMKL